MEKVTRYWSPISPFPYIGKLRGAGKKMLAITARYDPTFWPEFTNKFLDAVREQNIPIEALSLRWGQYLLGVAPLKYIAGHRFGRFLQKALT